MIVWCLALLLLLAGSGCRAPESPDTLYERARRELRKGNLDTALTETEKGLAALRGKPETAQYWRFVFLKSEALIATGKADRALELLDKTVPAGPSSKELSARQKSSQAYAKIRLSQYPESKRLLDRAYELATETGSPSLLAEVDNRRSAVMVFLREPAAADACARRALENGKLADDPYLRMAAFGNFGFCRLFTHRFDEAIPWFERMLPLARKEGYRRFEAKTLHNMGICYIHLGDLDRAFRLLSRAEPIYAEQGDLGHGECLGDLGTIYQARRDYQAAISCFRKALEVSGDIYRPTWLHDLATTSLEAGDLTSAEEFNRQATVLLEERQDQPGLVEPLLSSARIAEARKQGAEAERIYKQVIDKAAAFELPGLLIEGHARLGSLLARAGAWRQAERQFQQLTTAIETSRGKLERDEWKLTYQSSIVPFYQDYVDLLMDRGLANQALDVTESCRARLLAEKLGMDRSALQSPTTRSLQARAAAEKAVMLSYWLAPRRSFLWVITPGKVSAFVLPAEEEIRSLVEAYTNLLLSLEDPRESLNPTARRLYERLLAPVEQLIPRGSNVILAPDGVLHELNFETLVVGADQQRYWIEDVTIAIAPSLGVLGPAGRKPVAEQKSLLIMGSPVPPGPDYPPLPEAESEIEAIRSHFPAGARSVLTREQAYPGAYRDAGPGRFSLIHFSAHAEANRESPLDSAVILSRREDSYKLYARDVTALPLRAELVTISACRSAGGRHYGGEGLVGFSWAFLRAGARNVIAGLWDVNDRSTALLMTRLYEELTRGKAPAAALRAAKLAFLKEPTYKRPYHWAPFELFTRGMPFRPAPSSASR